MKLRFTALIIISICFAQLSFATVKLNAIFSDHMVLQQQRAAAIWGWATPLKKVSVTVSWNRQKYTTIADATGQWKVSINTPQPGGPYEIKIEDPQSSITLKDILIGEVWLLSGQSNMEMPMKGFKDQPVYRSNEALLESENDYLRLITVPRAVSTKALDTMKTCSWQAANAESVSNFSAAGYYFGRRLQKQLKVPVGLICISYGGSSAEAWMNATGLQSFPEIKIPALADKVNNRSATSLYNGMLHPFIGYTIKGCLWYQGESNYDHPDQYEKLFPAMVAQWRSDFKQGDFPFFFAQIAPYDYAQLPPYNAGGKYNSAWLREAQRRAALAIPNSGMAVLLDIGDATTIHPGEKEKVGERLALLALGKTYDKKGFGVSSPELDSSFVEGSVIRLKFKNASNGLTSYYKPLQLFEIAGADKNFRPAKAVISKGQVLVTAPEVPKPMYVRYAFKDFVIGELFNCEGLPLSSFTTEQ